MNNNKCFSRKALPVAVLAAITAQSALAQDSVEEEVLVTGIRQSLVQSMDVKRESSGVVDAISAEDIGKFPDTNLAESLQRITGVSIDRTRGEGNQVTVRGFGPAFNLVTLNGRQMPTSSALSSEPVSRSFNFREIAAESVSGVEVYKTGKAHVPSGGIGATINMKTAKPFDFDDLVARASVKGIIDTSVQSDKGDTMTPEVSGMISQTFMEGRLGLMASGSYSKRNYHQDTSGTSWYWNTGYPWAVGPVDTSEIDTEQNPDLAVWSTPEYGIQKADYERERVNGQLVLQFAPTDNVVASLDYTVANIEDKGEVARTSYWFDNYSAATADRNGTLKKVYRHDESLNFWAWEYNYETDNDSLGLNVEWQVNDSLSLSFDAHDSTSHANPGMLPAEKIANLNNFDEVVDISGFFDGDQGAVYVDDSRLGGGAYAKQNLQADLYQERGYEVENNIQQFQFGGILSTDMFGINTVNFGLAHTAYDLTVNELAESSFALRGGAMDISDLDILFVDGARGFDKYAEYDVNQFIRMVDEQGLTGTRTIFRDGVEEDTLAAYVSFDGEWSVADMPLKANIGLRYESTDVTAKTRAEPVIGFAYVTPSQLDRIYGDMQSLEDEGSYSELLPNLDFSLDFNESMVGRFSYSQTIARSSLDALYPGEVRITDARPGVFQANQGNPDLVPYKSDNIDLSFEWYYAEGSYASIGYFWKDVDNFIGLSTTTEDLMSPEGPVTDPSVNPRPGCPAQDNTACQSQPSDPVVQIDVARSVNQRSTSVDGLELNVQHLFGESGFGVVANYTFVDGEDEFDPKSFDNDFALNGLSDTANLVAFYDKHGFEARIAYNWRDKFYSGNDGNNPIEPKFTAAYSQIDANISYDLTDNFSIFWEGVNLTDEPTQVHGRWSNQVESYETYGPRYTIGGTMKF
ncbi:TonB-dependent receptor [Agaribacterium haliotis]|uniref:TonB-dependent receptor n=1 Tax=Agaribacterium haliotis TaxID=2013869 RepID=UPI000BB559BE|nr:TonB-dependent receptor [Agaribacterium haliotis]